MRTFKRAKIDIQLLPRNRTVENLLESINHGTREGLNININPMSQIAPECLDDYDDYLYLGKGKYVRTYGTIALMPFTDMLVYDVLFKTLGSNVDITFHLKKIVSKPSG